MNNKSGIGLGAIILVVLAFLWFRSKKASADGGGTGIAKFAVGDKIQDSNPVGPIWLITNVGTETYSVSSFPDNGMSYAPLSMSIVDALYHKVG